VQLTPVETIAENRTFEVAFKSVNVGAGRVVGPVEGGWQALRPARQRAIACKCAEMAGGAAAAQEMSVNYAKTRQAFGRPIGGFQAIQHKLVQMQSDLDQMRLAMHYAVWKLDAGADAAFEVAVAKAKASSGYSELCFEGHEIHAGIGFMREYDLQLFYRRAKQAEFEFGDARHHLTDIAEMLGRPGFEPGLP
jgi:alkylation response protein AidB-like acyl-CoA dehydrogenase